MTSILFCHPGSELYGSDLMALETASTLGAAGFNVQFVVPELGLLTERVAAEGAVVEVVSIPVLRKSFATATGLVKYGAASVAGVFRAVSFLRRSRPDVVYVNTIIQPTWMLAARLCRIPFVAHVREAEPDASILLRRLLVGPLVFARAIIANSAATKDFISSAGSHRLAARTTVVHNGKDWSHYFRSDFVPAKKAVRALLVGRLSPRKGQDVAIRAIAALRAEGLDATLTIVGSVFTGYEWYLAELKELAADLGVSDAVRFVGFVSDPSSLLQEATVAVVPSRIEPFGTVALEAMAAMRPVVVAGVGGLTEIVTDGETGVVVPADSPDALASAIRGLHHDPVRAAELARAGYAHVNSEFSRDAYATRVLAILRGVR